MHPLLPFLLLTIPEPSAAFAQVPPATNATTGPSVEVAREAATAAVMACEQLGFRIMATEGTARYLRERGVPAERVFKVHEGRPHAIDLVVNRQVQLLVNTPLGKHAQRDDYTIRQAAIAHGVPYTTTLSAAATPAHAG